MANCTSYDECGPLNYLGQIEFSAATGLPGGKSTFQIPVYLFSSDESRLVIEYNGYELDDLGTINDYYGFGTSAESALHDAQNTLGKLRGLNASFRLVTTLTTKPCYPSNKAPFYNGSQRIHHIPYTWSCDDPRCKETTRKFVVWENGTRTADALAFYDTVVALSKSDAAPDRKGSLRTVAERKHPTSRDDFLIL